MRSSACPNQHNQWKRRYIKKELIGNGQFANVYRCIEIEDPLKPLIVKIVARETMVRDEYKILKALAKKKFN
jgi:hypothetical protein